MTHHAYKLTPNIAPILPSRIELSPMLEEIILWGNIRSGMNLFNSFSKKKSILFTTVQKTRPSKTESTNTYSLPVRVDILIPKQNGNSNLN